ncbi:MAG: hypothetical protein CVU44_15045 [Chloroflexi bacterium HGW-Chloroflexi-6]|nr:MAG: hypothetical protein CVU44_15045 [Chloroflexi bacterium HGW-Chloroflexi-6]
MEKVFPEQPILDDGLRSVNFFNGRLLTAEDLTAEQAANRSSRRLLGQALGAGLAEGFFVSAPQLNNASSSALVVNVDGGLAVNRRGDVLKLSAKTTVALTGSLKTPGATVTAIFADCSGMPATGPSSAGLFLLTVSPASGGEGRASTGGLGNQSAPCNTRFTVEGVQFHLIRLSTPTPGSQLRNILAYQSFGFLPAASQTFPAALANPFAPASSVYGLLDTLPADKFPICHVPLALIYRTAQGIQFVDNWSVRRAVTSRTATQPWHMFDSPRRASEMESIFLQFQEHLAAILAEKNVAPKLKATERFKVLPPAGFLPLGASGFDWRVFLGTHAPARITPVDAGLLVDILTEAFDRSPFIVEDPSGPLAPVDVYYVPDETDMTTALTVFLKDKLALEEKLIVELVDSYTSYKPATNYEALYQPVNYLADKEAMYSTLSFAATDAIASDAVIEKAETNTFETNRISSKATNRIESALNQPAKDSVTRAPEASGPGFVLFARSRQGRIRVRFSPPPETKIKSTFTAASTESNLQTFAKSVPGGDIVFPNLEPGVYRVDGVQEGYKPIDNRSLAVVGGRISLLEITLGAPKLALCLALKSIERTNLTNVRMCLVTGTFKEAAAQSKLAPWLKLRKVKVLESLVVARLDEWQQALAAQFPGFDIAGGEPSIYVDPRIAYPNPPKSLPEIPKAYAVFGSFGIPLTVYGPTDLGRDPLPLAQIAELKGSDRELAASGFVEGGFQVSGLTDELLKMLYAYGIATFEQLGGAWLTLVTESTNLSSTQARQLIAAAVAYLKQVDG